ncbi:hypothetical protein [Carboxydothermus hydrogenoformans]|uniref:Conserved domain protein n=1 Tax=Carboxydothermus hydrogenoformans (strain ATCC BAA-161 / DSM 6008 / Z-2901) TaxID=246194 RepID=Q3AA75_CARHZ|nr:hypothetical protein [Carboxydothermus hydrogenoformans]ABB14103.1 conserved domain protein [Carboxydothermus hydrogenoformans Z-2901]
MYIKPEQQVLIANKKHVHYYPHKMNFTASKFLAYRDHYAKMKKIKEILNNCSMEDLPENEELKKYYKPKVLNNAKRGKTNFIKNYKNVLNSQFLTKGGGK